MILSPGLNMCTAHVLMRFCHLINRSFVCKAKEGRHVRITDTTKILLKVLFKHPSFFIWHKFLLQRKEKIAAAIEKQDKKKSDFKSGKMLGVSYMIYSIFIIICGNCNTNILECRGEYQTKKLRIQRTFVSIFIYWL